MDFQDLAMVYLACSMQKIDRDLLALLRLWFTGKGLGLGILGLNLFSWVGLILSLFTYTEVI